MKIRLVYLLFLSTLLCLFSISSKNGRASQDKKGNTGAPGDETNANGTPRICSYCHFGASAPVVTISLLDADSNAVTSYTPGQQYTARVEIQHSNTNLTGFGFQMIALRDSGNTDLDGFFDPGNNTVNNYKLATIPNGRTYAEHDNVSVNVNRFNVVWTAPPAGTGPLTFYASGNAVNRNGSTSGDGAASTLLHVPEATPSASSSPTASGNSIRILPNPVWNSAFIEVSLQRSGRYSIGLYDPAARRVWSAGTPLLVAGANRIALPASEWAPGVYFLEITGENWKGTEILVKN